MCQSCTQLLVFMQAYICLYLIADATRNPIPPKIAQNENVNLTALVAIVELGLCIDQLSHRGRQMLRMLTKSSRQITEGGSVHENYITINLMSLFVRLK